MNKRKLSEYLNEEQIKILLLLIERLAQRKRELHIDLAMEQFGDVNDDYRTMTEEDRWLNRLVNGLVQTDFGVSEADINRLENES